MNYFTQKSIDLANSSGYLDRLYDVYPVGESIEREIDEQLWEKVKYYFETKNCKELLKTLMKFSKFPIDDPYVSIFRYDRKQIDENPKQVQRICNKLFEMGIDELYRQCIQPKKESRRMGESFKNYVKKGILDYPIQTIEDSLTNNVDSILIGSDDKLKSFAAEYLGYNGDKGLDFIARIKGQFVIAETKFITDIGGSQNGQYKDARSLLDVPCNKNVRKICIIDGCVYKQSKNQIYMDFTENDIPVMSIFMVNEYLHSL